jgi:aminocarboxymuconate-semialdehyde decarboxylase
MIVDCHAHLVSPELMTAVRKEAARFPNIKQAETDHGLALTFGAAKQIRPVSKPLSDIPGRIAWMDKNGIDKQVTGGWVDMFGYELPGAEAEAWATVLKAARKAGFPGAMIGTLPRGVGSTLDAADLDPFWQAADETGAFIHIHPSFDAGDSRVNDFGLANGLGRVTDAVIAIARLISSGHVAKYKNVKFFAPIGGAGLPFVLGRLKKNHSITPGIGDPVAGLAALYTDTIVHDVRVLKFVIEMIGTDKLVLGSDMPFPIGDHEPTKIVAAAGLTPAQTASINGGLAQKLFNIQ